MGWLDGALQFINELNSSYDMYKQLQGFHAVDTTFSGGGYYGQSPKDQTDKQIKQVKDKRAKLFDEVDKIVEFYMAGIIKNIIINNGFNGFCGKNFIRVTYDSDDKKLNEICNKEIENFFRKTGFFDLFKDCLNNEGMNYGEMFLRTKTVIGKGITELVDDVNIRQHIALYKSLTPIGFIKFEKVDDIGRIQPQQYISKDEISHFIVSPEKISLSINYDFNKEIQLPEKIRCAKPILLPVVDLLIQYNQLSSLHIAIEVNKAIQGILIALGVSNYQDADEINKNRQQLEVALNRGRDAIIANLDNLDVSSLLQHMNRIIPLNYMVEDGVNQMQQIQINPPDSNLTEKLNNMRMEIAMAVGIPPSTLAYTPIKEKKEDILLTDPNFSRMLSSIQQSLARGIIDIVHKHLDFKFSKMGLDKVRKKTKDIDKQCINVKYKSTTNVDDRLDSANMLLALENVASMVSNWDLIGGSQNIPFKINAEKTLEACNSMLENYNMLQGTLEIDESLDGKNYDERFPDVNNDGIDDNNGLNIEDEKQLAAQNEIDNVENKEKNGDKSKEESKDKEIDIKQIYR